jgi:glycosyltransferase involved in cell wall biosynthesis
MTSLSAIIITKDEECNIGRCLRSLVSWVDEIIVLDSGSQDKTIDICRRYTSNIFITDWPGYGPQKNRALNLAKYKWVISLDADEWISPKLREEIKRAILQTEFEAYYMPRMNMFCGRFQRFGDASKDKVLRLFQRGSANFNQDIVHEKLICQGKIGFLKNPLFHNSYRTRQEWEAQMEKYAEMTAKLRYEKGKRSNPCKAVLNSGWIFFRSYILRQGFRDGATGLLFAQLNAKSSFKKNWLMWRLNHNS